MAYNQIQSIIKLIIWWSEIHSVKLIPWNDLQSADVSAPPGRARRSRDQIASNISGQPAR